MEENKKNPAAEEASPAKAETVEQSAAPEKENFNDNLHGENLTERAKVLSPGMTVLKRFFRSKLSIVGLVTIIFLFLFSFLGPLFSPWGANGGTVRDTSTTNIFGTYEAIEYVGPDGKTYIAYDVTLDEDLVNYNSLGDISGSHWMGTTLEGYDVFTRLMYGGRVSLTIGYFRGVIEAANIMDISRLYYMMAILCLMGWTGTARLVRGQILSLREQEFMLAAKCSGLSTGKKIFKHLPSNVIPQLIVSMTLGLGSIILMEATLGYLGIGAPPDAATWGTMIELAANARYRNYYPNLWLGAGICITLAILAFNFVGDGLRDAIDPKMKR